MADVPVPAFAYRESMSIWTSLSHEIESAVSSAAPSVVQVLPADARALRYGPTAAAVLDNPEMQPRIRALYGSDWTPAAQNFVRLVQRLPKLRAVDAGPLANAQHLESITTLLLNLNRRYRAITSVQMLGLDL